ncbi:MAG: hypothetical protein V1746_01950 [bacterium]
MDGKFHKNYQSGSLFNWKRKDPYTGEWREDFMKIAGRAIDKRTGKEIILKKEDFQNERLTNDPNVEIPLYFRNDPSKRVRYIPTTEIFKDIRFEELEKYLTNLKLSSSMKTELKGNPNTQEKWAWGITQEFRDKRKMLLSPDSVVKQARKMGIISDAPILSLASVENSNENSNLSNPSALSLDREFAPWKPRPNHVHFKIGSPYRVIHHGKKFVGRLLENPYGTVYIDKNLLNDSSFNFPFQLTYRIENGVPIRLSEAESIVVYIAGTSIGRDKRFTE